MCPIEKLFHSTAEKNSADPDQTAPKEQFDQCLHCLFLQICPTI